MSIIPLIIGSIFVVFGAHIIIQFSRFKNEGIKISGYVKGIEKYVSTTRNSNGARSSMLMFRSIVEYTFNGQTRFVKSVSTNEIRHRLNQKVPVVVIETEDGGIRARIDDAMHYFLGFIFLAVGLIAVAVYHFSENSSSVLTAILLIGSLGIAYFISPLLQKFKVQVKSDDDDQFIGEGSTLLETQEDYLKELNTHGFVGKIIALVALFIGVGLIYWGFSYLSGPQFKAGELQALLSDIGGLIGLIESGNLPSKWEKPLILIGMGGLFFLSAIHSFFYQRRKHRKLT
ncbi:hypothetical protein [Aliikangiella coralliicola]|uniref:DUF3592 domain-containing protein n=1 Tax=Aliikangiella coralliicola TaxID=2592383 RepID=A0A545UDT2_9GAMM|nr:hypothetical protein [Aliikangiella coralliicola]TQV87632.1 hypothetical protein FLL46_12240 [Aliikangiella coralliicola]